MQELQFMLTVNLFMTSLLLLKNRNIEDKINSMSYQINRLKQQNMQNDSHNNSQNNT